MSAINTPLFPVYSGMENGDDLAPRFNLLRTQLKWANASLGALQNDNNGYDNVMSLPIEVRKHAADQWLENQPANTMREPHRWSHFSDQFDSSRQQPAASPHTIASLPGLTPTNQQLLGTERPSFQPQPGQYEGLRSAFQQLQQRQAPYAEAALQSQAYNISSTLLTPPIAPQANASTPNHQKTGFTSQAQRGPPLLSHEYLAWEGHSDEDLSTYQDLSEPMSVTELDKTLEDF